MSNVHETLAAAFGQKYGGRPTYFQSNFKILADIVKFLKDRYLSGAIDDPLTLDEILEESEKALEVATKQKEWLKNEALEKNIRIKVIRPENGGDGAVRYQYRPVIDVKDRKGLVKYLMEKYQQGEGAVWYDEIVDSLPHGDRAVRKLEESGHLVVITRQADKKKVVFYNEGKLDEDKKVNEKFVDLWRSFSVEGITDDNIEEYLAKHGIQSIQKFMTQESQPTQQKRKTRRLKNFRSHNEHMKDVFEKYE